MKRIKGQSILFLVLITFLALAAAASDGRAQEATGGGALAAPAAPSGPPTVFAVAPGTIDSVVHAGGQIFWAHDGGCPGFEFDLEPCVIQSKPAGGGDTRTLHDNGAGPTIDSNLAADATHVYWIDSDGQIVSLSRGADPADSPTTLATVESTDKLYRVSVDDDYVYWVENVDQAGTANDSGKLFRAPKGGGGRQLMVSDSRSTLRQMRADQQGGVIYIRNVCGAFCLPDVIQRLRPNSSGGFYSQGDRANVQAYGFDDHTLFYAADLGPDGLHIETAPLSDLSDFSQGPDSADDDNAFVDGMAVSGTNLFWHWNRPAMGGPIFRLRLAGALTPLTANLQEVAFLTASSRYLFWEADNQILRLEADAEALELDLGIADIEITQGIQNLANDVPLVQDRSTLVRVFPAVSGYSGGSVAAYVTLHGTDGSGAPLPGSPLRTRIVTVKSAGNLRQNLADSANWTLPTNWRQGTITLRAEIEIYNLLDRNPSNDSLSLTRSFEPKSNICIKFIPLQDFTGQTYWARNLETGRLTPGFGPILSRMETMWPARYLLWYTRNVALRKPQFLGTPQPFNLVDGADWDHVIGALFEHNIYDSAPGWCGGDNARTHYVAMVHPAIDTTITRADGSMTTRFGQGSHGEPFSLVKMRGGAATDHHLPGGGATLVHEIGHNYNNLFSGLNDRWTHVDCGLPAGADPHEDYPYLTNSIGMTASTNIPRGYWGYDRLTRQPIAPDAAADYMSYCGPEWTSDYNWRGALEATQNLPGALRPAQAPAAPAAEALLVSGLINGAENAAELVTVHRVATELLGPAAARRLQLAAASPALSGSYQLQLLSAGGDVLASHPVTPEHIADGDNFLFSADVPFPAGARTVRLLRDGAEIARRTASSNAPQVTVTQPAAGAALSGDWTIAWTAADADGDALSYSVLYSADGGATWATLASSYGETSLEISGLEDLAGSADARVRVIANDGMNSGAGTSAPFSLANHAPRAYVDDPVAGAAFHVDETVVLRGKGVDAEEGLLPGGSLRWEIDGPAQLDAGGSDLLLDGLAPGIYTARLRAADGEGATGSAMVPFTVSPKRLVEGGAPLLDGYCDDEAYAADGHPLPLRYPAATAAGRFVRDAAGGTLYACFDGLLPANRAGEALQLRVDVNDSGGAFMSATDRLFAVGPDGAARTGHGDGTGDVILDATPQGLAAAVAEAADGRWSAEMRIEESALGGWGHMARLLAAVAAPGELRAVWPATAEAAAPAGWGMIALGRQPQTIDFRHPGAQAVTGSPFALEASASSGLPVSYTSQTPETCEAAGPVVTLLAGGTCIVEASQPGNESYLPAASVTRQFAVGGLPRVFLPLLSR